MTTKTFVLIPGAWHGGWAYDTVTTKMEQEGKKCISLTLPGLEIAYGIQDKIINLDTNIQYVVDILLKENITHIILCGHSYAGLVITGVADKIPERIHALVYIDAYIPKDGDSCWSLTSEAYRQIFVTGASGNGFTVADRPGADSRRRPHPLPTLLQSLHLTGNYQQVRNRTFIYMTGWEGTPFKKQYETLKNAPGWHIVTVPCGHDIMKENPDKLVEILNEIQ
jgi:pimeloyl-ACP methyl ester carboxylesterase